MRRKAKMKKRIMNWIGGGLLSLGLHACSAGPETMTDLNEWPQITPDYREVTIPYNIAPLNFSLFSEKETLYSVQVSAQGKRSDFEAKDGFVSFPIARWRDLLASAKDDSLTVRVVARRDGHLVAYRPFSIYVKSDAIDPYLAYRLIEPLYALWHDMGIYQRNLETFEQTAIYENRMTRENCVNCHSFCMQSPDRMLFHMRGDYNSTVLIREGIEVLNTKTRQSGTLVYPSWHPSGRFIAFSINDTHQGLDPRQRIEVYDKSSDVVVYDVEQRTVMTSPRLFSDQAFETFPTFSPDGRTLFYCTSPALPMPDSLKVSRYSLCAIGFDPETKSFGNRVDTLVNGEKTDKSISFPRVSPDGRYLMYTQSGYATFPIWHRDADLYLLDLETQIIRALDEVNSDRSDSYHSWSSNSRWFCFSSRRIDGLHTRPFFAYVGTDGQIGKPFLLPQETKDYYDRLMKSYNIPELVKGPVTTSAYAISSAVKNGANRKNVRFKMAE